MSEAEPTLSELEILLEEASSGDRGATEKFYTVLLHSSVVSPEKSQPHTPENLAPYPNEYLNLLALKDGDKVFVPIFTSSPALTEWSSNTKNHRTIAFKELLALIPDEWWLYLNPGQDASKDFSPWEISQLKLGAQALPEILDDLFSNEEVQSLEILSIANEEFPTLKEKLLQHAKSEPIIAMIYLARERGQSIEGETSFTMLIGLALDDSKYPSASTKAEQDQKTQEIIELVQNVAQRELIGGDRCRVLYGNDEGSISLSMFEDFEPIYKLEKSNKYFTSLFK